MLRITVETREQAEELLRMVEVIAREARWADGQKPTEWVPPLDLVHKDRRYIILNDPGFSCDPPNTIRTCLGRHPDAIPFPALPAARLLAELRPAAAEPEGLEMGTPPLTARDADSYVDSQDRLYFLTQRRLQELMRNYGKRRPPPAPRRQRKLEVPLEVEDKGFSGQRLMLVLDGDESIALELVNPNSKDRATLQELVDHYNAG